MVNETLYQPERLEPLALSPTTAAVLDGVLAIGPDIVRGQAEAVHSLGDKADLTPVSDQDVNSNIKFNEWMEFVFGGKVTVRGEEVSLLPTTPLEAGDDEIVISVDTIDGTGEHVAVYRDRRTGDPLDPRRPIPDDVWPELILPHERTTCTGAAIFRNGKLWAAVVLNPFTKQLIVADRDLGGAFLVPVEDVESGEITRGQRLSVSNEPFEPANAPWDAAVWPGAPVDVQFLAEIAGTPRRRYSAIGQAMDVALGKSVGAVFAGDSLHDVGPSVAAVLLAGGIVLKPDGTEVTMDNLLELIEAREERTLGMPVGGFVYTTPAAGEDFMRALNSDRKRYPFVSVADGWFFSPLYFVDRTVEDLVRFEERDGVRLPGRIFISSLGSGDHLSGREFREVRRRVRRLGGPWMSYRLDMPDTDTPIVRGRVKVWRPNREVEVAPGVTMKAADLALAALRSMVIYRSKRSEPLLRHGRSKNQQ